MATVIHRVRISTLKALVEASRQSAESLAGQFDAATSDAEKAAIANRYSKALKQTHALQRLLESMERKESEVTNETVKS